MPAERYARIALVLTLVSQFTVAQDTDTAPPDAELLEFIASFATDDGGWLDPLELDVATVPEDTEDEVQQ